MYNSSKVYSKFFLPLCETGSWYLGLFSQSILKMQEEGTLNDLKRKWWKEKYAGSCGVIFMAHSFNYFLSSSNVIKKIFYRKRRRMMQKHWVWLI